MQSVTPIVKNLLVLNVLFFALVALFDTAVPLENYLVLYPLQDGDFRPWQLLTHAFMHADFMHILFNMLFLYFLGPAVEERIGANRFLILYVVAIFGAVAAHYGSPFLTSWQLERAMEAFVANPTLENFDDFFRGMNMDEMLYNTLNNRGQVVGSEGAASVMGEIQNQLVFAEGNQATIDRAESIMRDVIQFYNSGYLLGASGAVSGVAAAFAFFYPQRNLSPLFVPIKIPAAYMIGGLFLLDFVLGFLRLSGDNIAHFAHIGGALAGLVLAYYYSKTTTPPWLRRVN